MPESTHPTEPATGGCVTATTGRDPRACRGEALPPALNRRAALAGLTGGLALLQAGCGTSPPVRLYLLHSAAPESAPPPPPGLPVWQLLLPVRVPEYLDREALLLPQGQAGLLAASGQRWAESLRDAVPRVLRQDLAALRGEASLWLAPLPPGLAAPGVPVPQLRVELQGFEAEPGQGAVRLLARWTLSDPAGQAAPLMRTAALREAVRDGSIDALVAAHRLALWRLAQRIAATGAGG